MPRKTNGLLDSFGTLSPRAPSARERIAGLLADITGQDNRQGYQSLLGLLGQSSSATPESKLMEMANPVGGLLGAYDAGTDIGNGNYLAGGLGLLASMPGLPKINRSERLFHGTARDFDKFRPGRINDATHTPHDTPAVFLTNSPELANEYAASAGKGRLQQIEDIYGRHGRAPPQSYYQASDMNERQRFHLNEAISAIPDDYPHKKFLTDSIRAGHPISRQALIEDLGQTGAQIAQSLDNADSVFEHYPTGSNVRPVYGPENVLEVDGGFFGGNFNEIIYDQLLKRAKAEGYDGLRVRNVIDSPSGRGEPADIVAVFSPEGITSTLEIASGHRAGIEKAGGNPSNGK